MVLPRVIYQSRIKTNFEIILYCDWIVLKNNISLHTPIPIYANTNRNFDEWNLESIHDTIKCDNISGILFIWLFYIVEYLYYLRAE